MRLIVPLDAGHLPADRRVTQPQSAQEHSIPFASDAAENHETRRKAADRGSDVEAQIP